MGQYWKVVNLTKHEFVIPHKLGAGLKLWEQLANHPGTGAALIVLCAAMPEARGGGDLDLDQNWHLPERKDYSNAGKMPEEYPPIAKRTIGRWAGDRIALIGDYAEDGDLSGTDVPAGSIYRRCDEGDVELRAKVAELKMQLKTAKSPTEKAQIRNEIKSTEPWQDISDDVAKVIEHELVGKFEGDGWRKWVPAK